jgi:hypothetical protein
VELQATLLKAVIYSKNPSYLFKLTINKSISFATTTSPLTCYSFNSATGQFTFAGQSALTLAGVGAPVVTSLNGQAGTAVVSNLSI